MGAEVDLLLQNERGRLFSLAYRMLGSAGEAEDAVQEAFTRWYAQPRDAVQNPAGFLTTMVANICLDQLKSARRKREEYPGVWLPEPVAALEDGPEEDLQRLESISLAFVSLLEALSPLERAVFVLVEVFDYAHAEVAAMLDRTPEACRQALHRARRSLAAHRRAVAPAERHRALLLSFVAAVKRGDVDELARMLADDVASRADGGGFVNAAARPITGVRAVSRLFAGLSKQVPPDLAVRIETVNGWPAALLSSGDVLWSVVQLHADDGERILRIDNVMNPHKLARVAAAFGFRTATGAP